MGHRCGFGLGTGVGARAGPDGRDRVPGGAHPESLRQTKYLINEEGAKAEICPGDVTDRRFVASAMGEARVDVLINSAGRNIPEHLDAITPESYSAVMAVNVEATLFVTQQAVARMRACGEGGSIVSISSQMGHVGGPQRVVYCTSKWALEGLTKALALELATENIRVNTVAPTFVETDLTAASLAHPEFRNWALGSIPMGRLGRVDEVAAAVRLPPRAAAPC